MSSEDFRGIDDTSSGRCSAALNIAGQAYRCDLATRHNGWAHQSREAEAIWDGPDAWKGDES